MYLKFKLHISGIRFFKPFLSRLQWFSLGTEAKCQFEMPLFVFWAYAHSIAPNSNGFVSKTKTKPKQTSKTEIKHIYREQMNRFSMGITFLMKITFRSAIFNYISKYAAINKPTPGSQLGYVCLIRHVFMIRTQSSDNC